MSDTQPNNPDGVIVTASVTYTPWTDGYVVGFCVRRHSDGAVGYIYLKPSVDDDPDSTPDVVLYQGVNGDPAQDGAEHYYNTVDSFDY